MPNNVGPLNSSVTRSWIPAVLNKGAGQAGKDDKNNVMRDRYDAYAAKQDPTAARALHHGNTLIILDKRNGPIEDFIQHRLVMTDRSRVRRIWNLVLFVCLVWTGIGLPFRLAFIEFHIPNALDNDDDFWYYFEKGVDVFFVLDLVVCFFCTYRNSKDKEIIDVRKIIKRYLMTYFPVNLVACIPSEAVSLVITAIADGNAGDNKSTQAHKTIRVSRLQRMSRLARLIRLVRMTKLVSFCMDTQVMQYVQSLRGIRVMNFLGGLMWVVHLTACGWYICASLHEDKDNTWVGRRSVGVPPNDVPLYTQGPFDEWLHSMYFVLTVFTTVGFGDISASTVGEIIYVIFVMMLGAVVNGIVLSEVINVITQADQKCKEINEQKELVADFAEHTNLDQKFSRLLVDWVKQAKARNHGYNRERMKDLITSLGLPRALVGKLPEAVFGGRLHNNKLLTLSSVTGNYLSVPHRFPLLVALAGNPRSFDCEEIVYHCCDHAWNIFLVLKGVFAAVASLVPEGGLKELAPVQAIERPAECPAAAASSVVVNQHQKTRLDFDVTMSSCMRADKTLLGSQSIAPYQFYCHGNYFGDIEIVLPGSRPRRNTVRCESEKGGKLLVLSKRDLLSLTSEFPQAARAWRCIAVRREDRRRMLHKVFDMQGGYLDVAATFVQRYWKKWRERRKNNSTSFAEHHCETVSFLDGLAQIQAQPQRHKSYYNEADAPKYARKLTTDMACVRGEVKTLRTDVSALNNKLDLILEALGGKRVPDIVGL